MTEREFARKFIVVPEKYNIQANRTIEREIDGLVVHGVSNAVLRRTVDDLGPVLALASLMESVAVEFIESPRRLDQTF